MRRFNKCAEQKSKHRKWWEYLKYEMERKKGTKRHTQINSHASTMQNVIRLKCIWRINGQARRNNPIKICWIGVIFWTFVMPLNGIFQMVCEHKRKCALVVHFFFAEMEKRSIVKRSIQTVWLVSCKCERCGEKRAFESIQTLTNQSSNYW